jgi:hypothetical protein
MEELQNHIPMLWDEYAVDAETNLSPAALVCGRAYKQR